MKKHCTYIILIMALIIAISGLAGCAQKDQQQAGEKPDGSTVIIDADNIHEILDADDVYRCNVNPFMSKAIQNIDEFTELEVIGGKRVLMLNNGTDTAADVILFEQGSYRVVQSSDGRQYDEAFRHCYYAVGPENDGVRELLLMCTNVPGIGYNDAVLWLDSDDGGMWIKSIDAELEGYYSVDGTENILDDEESRAAAIRDYKVSVEAEMQRAKTAGEVTDFRWEYVKIDTNETMRYLKLYAGSDWARSKEITTDYMINNLLALDVKYYCRYNQSKAVPAGGTNAFDEAHIYSVYMLRDESTGHWQVANIQRH